MTNRLEILRRQYFALYPTYLLTPPPSAQLISEEGQRYLLSHLLGMEDEGVLLLLVKDDDGSGKNGVQPQQPEEGYRRAFWRKIIGWMEDGLASTSLSHGADEQVDIEIDDRFYNLLAELMVSTSTSQTHGTAPKASYRTFIYDLPGPLSATTSRKQEKEGRITLLEEQIAIQAGTTGLRTWTAALHLAHHIIHHPHLLFSTTMDTALKRGVVELGAGTGLVSILLGQLGVDVITTDLGDESTQGGRSGEDVASTPLARLRANIALNAKACIKPPVARALDWTDASSSASASGLKPAIWTQLEQEGRTILAADVIYDPSLVLPLVETIDVLLGSETDANAIVSATLRNQETFDLFLKTCETHQLSVEHLNLPPVDPACPTFWDSALDAGTHVRIVRISKNPSPQIQSQTA